MCGIFGIFGQSYSLDINQHISLLEHRGPDHQEICQENSVLFAHTRLSIVDVKHGHQPLISPDKRYYLICNGEIYNHQEWRDKLGDEYDFQTDTDSEVIIALYQKYGVDALQYLDGMFAFALYDAVDDAIMLARDPIGIKPLYYGWTNDTLYFASEIKALQNLYNDIQEFPPGHYYTPDAGIVKYYDLVQVSEKSYHDGIDTSVAFDDIYVTLKQAVGKRLMSDVPVGVYLSGGLDSTIVASLVAQTLPDVHSFSVGVDGSSDLENAQIAADYLGTQHHKYVYDFDEVLEALPQVIYYLESFDPLLVRSAIPNYFLAKLTRQFVTVVLTGEGADELYAGYHYLKSYTGKPLHDELVNLTSTLYNCNLQRCDRMTMAHSIEGRVPFLDTAFIELSMRVSLADKIDRKDNIEKWALRKAFEDILPKNVAWRTKEQFSKGAGSSRWLEAHAEQVISDEQFNRETTELLPPLRQSITTKETLLYYREFKKFFNESAVNLVKLWQGVDVA